MSWYAKNPAPPPEWDVCWDFKSKTRQGGGQQSQDKGSGKGRAGGGKGRGRGGGKGGRGREGSWGSNWWETPVPPWAAPWPASFWGGGGVMSPWLMQGQGPGKYNQAYPGPVGGGAADKPWWAGGAGGKGGGKKGGSTDLELGELAPSLEKRLTEKQKSGRKAPAAPPPPPPDKEFEGSLKSLSAKHGYGFIVCEEVHSLYQRDTYLPEELVEEGMKVLDRVKFRINLSKKGHPQASSCSVLKL